MFRKIKENLRAIPPLLIGIVLVGIFGSLLFYYLTDPVTAYPSERDMDILYNCERADSSPSVFLELYPVSDTQTIDVFIIIQKYKEFLSNCDSIQIYFPGATYSHRHVIQRGINVFPEVPIGTPFENLGKFRPLLPDADWSIPLLPSQMEINSYKNIIKIYPKRIENFTGAIEFFWPHAYRKLGFAKLGFSLSFCNVPWVPNAQLCRVKNYTVRVWDPTPNYTLVSAIPQPSEFPLKGYYYFNIDIYKTDLIAIFENKKLLEIRNFYLIIFSTLLGIGVALITEEIIGFIKAKRTAK